MKQKLFEIQIEIEVPKKCGCIGNNKVWTSVCPSGSVIPYRFTTKQTAIDMAEMCYGSTFTNYKII